MDWVRQWLRDYRFSPLHLSFLLTYFIYFILYFNGKKRGRKERKKKKKSFVFSGSVVLTRSWTQHLLICSQGKSHETSVDKFCLIHMTTVRLRDSTTPTADLLLQGTFLSNMLHSSGQKGSRHSIPSKAARVMTNSVPSEGVWPVSIANNFLLVFFSFKKKSRLDAVQVFFQLKKNYNLIMKYNLLKKMPWEYPERDNAHINAFKANIQHASCKFWYV